MMWCYCHHLRSSSILREFHYEDNFNNTFDVKSFQLQRFGCSEIMPKVVNVFEKGKIFADIFLLMRKIDCDNMMLKYRCCIAI